MKYSEFLEYKSELDEPNSEFLGVTSSMFLHKQLQVWKK